jgi:hypothetical protein
MEVTRQKSRVKPELIHLINGFNLPSQSASLSKSRTPERTYFNNRGTTERLVSKRLHLSHSERLEAKRRTKGKLGELLGQLGEVELVDRLKMCSTKFSTITCGLHVISRKPLHHCDFRLCPFCASRRSQRIIKKYVPASREFLKIGSKTPVHLVLTQAHRKGELLIESRKRLMASFKKLGKRKFFENHFAGGLYAVEFTLAEDGCWHSHLHLLGFRRRFFDIAILRAEWLEITGDSHVLRLDKITDISTGLREVVKYISKPLDIERFDKSHIRQFLQLKGCRMFGAFGEFAKFCRTFEPSDNDADAGEENVSGFTEGECCPVCEKPLFEMVLTVGELVGFLRQIEVVPRR